MMDLQALLEDRGAALTSPDTAIQTDQLIQSWINDVRLESKALPNSSDSLSSVDWLHGDAAQSAKAIVQDLMTKNLDIRTKSVKKSHDPTVSMDMRHKKVRERRVAREQRKARQSARESLANEAHQEATEIVKMEETQSLARRKRDEQIIAHHMTQIRAELREKEQRSRLVAVDTIPLINPVAEAEKFIKDERKRQSTRIELLKQLEEIETLEAKNNVKLLHNCFSRWYQMVVVERGKVVKAAAVCEWRLLAKVWGAWLGWVGACQRRRERDQATRELQRHRILYQRASSHHRSRLLSKILRGWGTWVQRVQAERREEATKVVYKTKMEALLAAAAQRVVNIDESPVEVVHVPSKPRQKMTTSQPTDTIQSSPTPTKPPISATPIQPKPPISATPKPATPSQPKPPIPHQPSAQHSLWKTAKDEMAQVLARVESETTKNEKNTTSIVKKDTKKRPPNKITRPIPLSAMEHRSVAMAERRAARVARQTAREEERLEALAREEEERTRAEAEARREREATRRAERMAAKQRELEREERRNQMETLNQKASDHYKLALLRSKGLNAWVRFTVAMRDGRVLADKVRGQSLVKRTFVRWKVVRGQRSMARNRMAEELHNRHLQKQSMKAWKDYMVECARLEVLAETSVIRLLTRRVFRGWSRLTREGRVRGWEMDRQARKMHERSLKSRVLRCWVTFVPLSREERAQKSRRAQLRRKVASWLQDYSPTTEY